MSLYDCSGFLYVVTPTSHHWRSILLKFFGHIARGDPSMDHSRALRFSVAPLPRDWNRRSGRPHHTRQIPNRCSYLTDCNFLIRMLFADTYWWCFYLYYAFLTLTFNISLFLNCGLSIFQQEAFEKCWAHSRLRAASRPLTRCRYRYSRLRIDVHDANDTDNAWQRGLLWPHGMGPITGAVRIAASKQLCLSGRTSTISQGRDVNVGASIERWLITPLFFSLAFHYQ